MAPGPLVPSLALGTLCALGQLAYETLSRGDAAAVAGVVEAAVPAAVVVGNAVAGATPQERSGSCGDVVDEGAAAWVT